MTIATEIYYPDTDGQPMAESDYQRFYIVYGTEVLDIFFTDRADVYVSGNLLIYYEAGNPKACISPDVFVVFNRPKGKRSSYKVWQEDNCYPSFVLEVTSKSSANQDQGHKRDIYASWGVREYFLYDPTADYLEPSLQGYRLVDGDYYPIVSSIEGSLMSRVLGLELRLEGEELRFYNPATGEKLLTHREAELARRDAEVARRDAEVGRRNAEIACRDAEVARHDAEIARRDAEIARHDAEVARRDAEDKAARLADRLRELGIDPDTIQGL